MRLARQKSISILVQPVAGSEGGRWVVTDGAGAGPAETCALADLPVVVSRVAFDHDGAAEGGAR